MPDNVHVFADDRVERLPVERDGEQVCALYGRSYRRSGETANFARDFRRDTADTVAIGVLHTNVGGRPGYDNYAPCTLEDLRSGGMDYWALGHIHKPEILSESPFAVYAGCPQGLDPTQSGARGCYMVTIDGGSVSAEFVALAAVEWQQADVDISEAQRLDDVRDAIAGAVDAALASAKAPVIVRLDLVGRSEAHAALQVAGALQALVEDAREEALGFEPWAWVDRVAIGPDPPSTSRGFAAPGISPGMSCGLPTTCSPTKSRERRSWMMSRPRCSRGSPMRRWHRMSTTSSPGRGIWRSTGSWRAMPDETTPDRGSVFRRDVRAFAR